MINFLAENPWFVILILIWTIPWKGIALWKAARNGHVSWFVAVLILNTFAILDIFYIFIFSKRVKIEKNQQQDISQQIPSQETFVQENPVSLNQINTESRKTVIKIM